MTIEILLNKLIEKGWNVFGHKDRINAEKCKYSEGIFYEFENHNMSISLRELVSKESGLRQFVCENKMIRITENNSLCNWLFGEEIYYDETQTEKLYKNDNYHYWLIECALKDESELEKFLIDNIKVDESELEKFLIDNIKVDE